MLFQSLLARVFAILFVEVSDTSSLVSSCLFLWRLLLDRSLSSSIFRKWSDFPFPDVLMVREESSSFRGMLFLLFSTLIAFLREATTSSNYFFCWCNLYRSFICPEISYFNLFSRYMLSFSESLRCCRARCVSSSSLLSFWATLSNQSILYSVCTEHSVLFLLFISANSTKRHYFQEKQFSSYFCFSLKEEMKVFSFQRIFLLTCAFCTCTSLWKSAKEKLVWVVLGSALAFLTRKSLASFWALLKKASISCSYPSQGVQLQMLPCFLVSRMYLVSSSVVSACSTSDLWLSSWQMMVSISCCLFFLILCSFSTLSCSRMR